MMDFAEATKMNINKLLLNVITSKYMILINNYTDTHPEDRQYRY